MNGPYYNTFIGGEIPRFGGRGQVFASICILSKIVSDVRLQHALICEVTATGKYESSRNGLEWASIFEEILLKPSQAPMFRTSDTSLGFDTPEL